MLLKKRTISKGISLTMALCVVLTAAGCAKKEAPAKAVDLLSGVEKPASISAFLDTDMFIEPKNNQAAMVAEFKKITGIELKLTQPAHSQYAEKLGLMFTSGTTFDVVEANGSTYVQYASSGALYDMTDLIHNSSVYKAMDQQFINALKVKGKIYGAPWSKGTGTVTYLRQDWLDKLNLKTPTNYNEFIDVLKAFATKDPDGNGNPKDTIPLTAAGLIYGDSKSPSDAAIYLPEFYQGASPDFEIKNGKWVDGFVQKDTIAAFTRLQSAYAQGLIDKEIITNNTSQCRDKWNSGNVGVINYWAGTWNSNLGDSVKNKVKTANMVAINPIKETKYIERAPTSVCISAKCANPKAVFKYFMEFIHDGKVDGGTMLFTHGVQGIHYAVKDGVYSTLPQPSNPAAKMDKAVVEIGLNLEKNFVDPIKPDQRVTDSMNILKAHSTISALFPASNSYNSNLTDLTTLRNKAINDIVINGKSADTAVADYKTKAKALVDPILTEFNGGTAQK